MPCTGPDLKRARQLGHDVGEELLARLIDQHSMWDVSIAKRDNPGYFFLPGADKRWEKATKKFIEAVEDLFEEDAANSF